MRDGGAGAPPQHGRDLGNGPVPAGIAREQHAEGLPESLDAPFQARGKV